MIIRGQTSLSQAHVSDTQHDLLASLWIGSIEEAVAAVAALGDRQDILPDTAMRSLSSSPDVLHAINPARLAEIQRARKGGDLGCLVDDRALDEFNRMGRLRSVRAVPSGAFGAEVPNSIRLMDRMPPVRDQGQRGTCVAFGAVALREYLLGTRDDLSEQFLYWACKELDGQPGPGTYIHTAMTALAEYGVCKESLWPYNPEQTADEGQGPPSQGAEDDARLHSLDSTRTVEPNLVLHYKKALAGGAGTDGMPVTMGSLVFDSWHKSAETNRTGKITLPFPGESPSGGHAWCVVGYVDDSEVPGGGYFILRNSWGEGWAPDSPEAPGHALMPYDYVERFTFEAFTGPGSAITQAGSSVEPEWQEYVLRLQQDERDVDGKLLKTGTPVLCNPLLPGALREDTPANRQEFLDGDRTWTPEHRQQVWFPPVSTVTDALACQADECRSAKQAFLAAIDTNLMSAKGQPIPSVRELPFWFAVLAWEPKIRDVTEAADLTGQLASRLAERSRLPNGVMWPDEWRQWLEGVNGTKVYALKGMGTTFHVVAAAVCCARIQLPGQPEVVSPGQETIDLVRQVYAQWSRDRSSRAAFTFFVLGSALPWPDHAATDAAGSHWVVVSSRRSDGMWHTSAPPRFADRLSLRNFLDRLRPETRQQRISRTKDYVDRILTTGFEGNLYLEAIAKDTGYRRTAVEEAALALQASGHYRVYRTPEGALAIGGKGTLLGRTVTSENLRRQWLGYLVILGPAASAGSWFVKDLILGRPVDGLGFLALLPLVYTGKWLHTRIQIWRENKE